MADRSVSPTEMSRTFAIVDARQIDQKPSRQPSQNRLVKIERSIGGADNDDPLLAIRDCRVQTIHLLHELGEELVVRPAATRVLAGPCAK